MTIKVGKLEYEWQENWAKLPTMTGWSHHGLIINKEGNIITGHATEPKILILNKDGELLREFDAPVTETHGLCLAEENGKEVLWIADTGSKPRPQISGKARVVKIDMEGKELAEITAADVGYGSEENFCPTTVGVNSTNGDIWIADGYGSSRIIRFDKNLKRLKTISGSGKIGMFSCPHWLYIDTRKGEPQIYVADRSNNRVHIFNQEGNLVGGITEGLITPSVFCSFDEYMVIGELNARLVILDKEDNILGYIGDGKEYLEKEGWPNRKNGKETISPLSDIEPGKFNSPHGMATDCEGNIYISEWLIGDRFIKLKRTA